MALWIHNVTHPDFADQNEQDYEVKVNRETLARFKHLRSKGAAECLRSAADAIDALATQGADNGG